MKVFRSLLDTSAFVLISIGLSTAAFALGGCVDSPESPTLLLALLGAAAMTLPRLRRRWRDRGGRS